MLCISQIQPNLPNFSQFMFGLFGINLDGIPGTENTPYAFGLFTAGIFVLGVVLIAGLKPESSKHFRRDRIERAFS